MGFLLLIVGLVGSIIYGILWIISLVKKNGLAKKRFITSIILFVVMIIGTTMIDTGDADQTSAEADEPSEEVKEEMDQEAQEEKPEKEETEKEEPKEDIQFDYQQSEYLPATEEYKIVVNTTLPEGTDVTFGLAGEESDYDYNGVPESAKVKDGQLAVSLGKYVDEIDGREYIKNGTFELSASLSIHTDHKRNLHLLEEYGTYDEFVKNYKIDGDVTQTDYGYMIEGIGKKEVTITKAYSQEQIDQKRAEQKKAEAKNLEYARLKKNPDRHAGEYVTYTGEIVEINEGQGLTQLRLGLDEWHNDILFVEYDGYTDFIEGDQVTIYGEVYGSYSYTSQAGWEITLPGILADTVE